MAAIKYKVKLTESERTCLNEVSHRGKPSVRTVKRALALLKDDEGLGDRVIVDVTGRTNCRLSINVPLHMCSGTFSIIPMLPA